MPEFMADVLTYELGEIGFSTFETENNTLIAYAKQTHRCAHVHTHTYNSCGLDRFLCCRTCWKPLTCL